MTARIATTLAAQTFAKLRELHGLLGQTFPCGWDAYRATMVDFYEINGGMLDAIYRLGHLTAGANFVRLSR
jgi:hypothetical protein